MFGSLGNDTVVSKIFLHENDFRRLVYNYPLDEITAALFTHTVKRFGSMGEFLYNVFSNAIDYTETYTYSGIRDVDIFEPYLQEIMSNDIVLHCSETMTFVPDTTNGIDMDQILFSIGFPMMDTAECLRASTVMENYIKSIFDILIEPPRTSDKIFCFILVDQGIMSLSTTIPHR